MTFWSINGFRLERIWGSADEEMDELRKVPLGNGWDIAREMSHGWVEE